MVIRRSLRSQRLFRHQTVLTQALEHGGRPAAVGVASGPFQALVLGWPLSCQSLADRLLERHWFRRNQPSRIPLIRERRNVRGYHRQAGRKVLEELHRVHMAGVVVDLQRQQGNIGLSQISRQGGVRPRPEHMHVGQAFKRRNIRCWIGFSDRTDEHVSPVRSGSRQTLEHRQIQFVGIDRTDEDQHGPLNRWPVVWGGPLRLKRLAEVVGIRHIPEIVTPRIQGSKRLLQLRSCCEQGIGGSAEIPFCRFQSRHRHPRLRLDPINTVINHGVKLA